MEGTPDLVVDTALLVRPAPAVVSDGNARV